MRHDVPDEGEGQRGFNGQPLLKGIDAGTGYDISSGAESGTEKNDGNKPNSFSQKKDSLCLYRDSPVGWDTITDNPASPVLLIGYL